jgi:nitroreductase
MENTSATIERQLEHRSIREFTGEPVSEAVLDALCNVINRTATSTGMQTFSVIRVTDPDLKRRISEVCAQEYLTRTTELFIFIVDAHRNARIARAQGYEGPEYRDMDRFFSGYTDAAIAAQNLTNAVESLGMGAVYFGSILNDQEAIIDILGLPELTFPVVGVGFGVPAQDPQIKPRMAIPMKFFENRYALPADFDEQLAAYDETMREYYDTRAGGRRSDTFSQQVIARLKGAIPKRAQMLRTVKKQGFDLDLG